MKKFFGSLLKFDIFFIIIISLIFFGVAFQYSAVRSWTPWAMNHMVKAFIFFPIIFIIQYLKPSFLKKSAYPIYFINLILLICVYLFGIIGMGAQRWINLYIFKLQPSEIMKITLILMLSHYYSCVSSDKLKSLKTHIIPFIATVIPFVLIAKQPDLGTALIILFVGLFSIFISGLNIRYILLGMIFFAISIPYIWSKLYDYQKMRILTFLNPESDPLGSGYHVIQSKIAIGSAGMYGKGFFNGTQSKLNFLPEKHTDFIFSTISEETGFIGSIFIIFLYILLIYCILRVAVKTYNTFYTMIIVNIAFLLFCHMVVNIGMVIGILPVVGVPLPLISYGGSSLLTFFILFGLVIYVGMNKDR